ncbi:Nitroreductase family [Seminavis robusta]|uniref:Nitroreductase family n=1 Tax=Seminavis robusta TaxID=568900 RepID=A0A9N8DNF6_9STRA|nr:Nitroreductase family [Seminavis robusta]|eukprot:Sro152_g069530.1 Nitroreductase family (267) ;mRNA; r:69542-70342
MSTAASVFRSIAHARKTAKRFQTGRVIPRDVLQDVLESTLRAPSGFNLQPTQIIMVHSSSLKKQLSDQAMLGLGNQYRTMDSSTLAVFLSDLEAGKRIERIHELEHASKMRHPNYLGQMPLASSFLLGQGHAATLVKNMATDFLSEWQPMPLVEPVHAWAYKNTALALQSYVLAATSHGLGTAIMEGFDARKLKEILRVPDRYAACACVATGYEYQEDDSNNEESKPSPRLELEEVVFGDTFGQAWEFDDPSQEEEEVEDSTAKTA